MWNQHQRDHPLFWNEQTELYTNEPTDQPNHKPLPKHTRTNNVHTLKHTNRLSGIVHRTSTHDSTINMRPHVVASPLVLASAAIRKLSENETTHTKKTAIHKLQQQRSTNGIMHYAVSLCMYLYDIDIDIRYKHRYTNINSRYFTVKKPGQYGNFYQYWSPPEHDAAQYRHYIVYSSRAYLLLLKCNQYVYIDSYSTTTRHINFHWTRNTPHPSDATGLLLKIMSMQKDWWIVTCYLNIRRTAFRLFFDTDDQYSITTKYMMTWFMIFMFVLLVLHHDSVSRAYFCVLST